MGRVRLDIPVIILLLILAGMSPNAWSVGVMHVSDSQPAMEIAPHLEVHEDSTGALDLAAARSAQWHPLSPGTETVNFGYTRSTVWIRFTLLNTDDHTVRRFVEIGYPILDSIEVYLLSDGQVFERLMLGDKQSFDMRPIEHRNFIVPVDLPAGEPVEVIMKVASTGSLQVPLMLWDNASLMKHLQDQSIFSGLYFGAMLVLMLYNLFLCFSIREAHYVYYVFYLGAVCIFIASLNGLSFQYAWPQATQWNDRSTLVGLGLVIVFAGAFTYRFLDIKRHHPLLGQALQIAVAFALIECVLATFVPYRIGVIMLIVTAVVAISLAMAGGLILWSQGSRPAMIYCTAWFSFLAAGVVLALNKFGLVPRNMLTENAIQIGSALEGILLSIALADRLNEEKQRRFQAQKERLEHERIAREAQAEALEQEKNARAAQERALSHEREAREAQAMALRLQQRANETLEQKVRERTQELELANSKLKELSFTDGLTGLRNRRSFDKTLDDLLIRSATEGSGVALLLLDIDHFKKLNDQYGHLVGDDCLKMLAGLLLAQVHRDDDLVARYGGEEFALILPDTDHPGALHVAEKIRASVAAASHRDKDAEVQFTVSLGVCWLVADETTTAHDIIERADEALYASKSSGRNRVTALPYQRS